MVCDFSFPHYRKIIKQALDNDFSLTGYRDYLKCRHKPKIILLRHDIDYSPARALEMALIEDSLGVHATYFVRVHGEYYHPFDRLNFQIFRKILKLGHEIGLHFEARNLAKIFKCQALDLFKKEKEILETILPIKIESAAEHGDLDGAENFWKDHFFSKVKKESVGIKNYPQEKKFQDFHYISDSRGVWRNNCFCQSLKKYPRIQVLIHADLWGKDAIKERDEMLKSNPIIKSKQFSLQYKKNLEFLLKRS